MNSSGDSRPVITDDPFIVGDLPPGAVEAGWRHGGALAVHRLPPMNRPLSMLLLGPLDDVYELVVRLLRDGELDGVRGVTTERHALDAVTAQLRSAGIELGHGGDWDWMWTTTPPIPRFGEQEIVELDDIADADEIRRFYANANPGAESQPGEGVAQLWLGVRDRAGLVAAGSLHSTPAGYPHLTGIAVDPATRGRGLGMTLSAALTRRALERSSMSTLGMYADNDTARAVYTRLGYQVARAWSSRAFA